MRRVLGLLVLVVAAHAGEDAAALAERLTGDAALERYEAARALGAMGRKAEPAVSALVGALRDPEPWVRVEVGRALVRVGVRAADVPALIARFEHAGPALGVLLATAVADVGEPAVPALMKALGSNDERIRRGALSALARAGRHAVEALPLLVDLTRDEDAAVARLAGEAVRRVGPWGAEYVPEILDRVRGADEQLRWVAIGVLGMIGPAAKEAIPLLKELRADGPVRLKEAAAGALRLIDVARQAKAQHPILRKPTFAITKAPARFAVKFETTKGDFVVEVVRAWAPHGADRFFNLIRIGYFDDTAFFRVVKGFVIQFGLHGDSRVNSVWKDANIPDDPVKETNTKGTLTYAAAGPDTRTTQVFFNMRNNAELDKDGFAPFGKIIAGLKVVESLYSGYGDMPAFKGNGPDPRGILTLGNAYLKREFPKLDYIERATLVRKRTRAEQEKFEAAVERKEVLIGMTEDEVRRAFGDPQRTKRTTYKGKRVTAWEYEFSEIYFGVESHVVGWISR